MKRKELTTEEIEAKKIPRAIRTGDLLFFIKLILPIGVKAIGYNIAVSAVSNKHSCSTRDRVSNYDTGEQSKNKRQRRENYMQFLFHRFVSFLPA